MDKFYLAAVKNADTGKFDVPIAQGTVTNHTVVETKEGFDTKDEADNWALCQIIDSVPVKKRRRRNG